MGSGYGEWLCGVVIGSGYREWLWGVVMGSGYGEWLWGVVIGSGHGRSLKNGPSSFSRRGGGKRAVSKRAGRSANDIRASVDR